MVTKSFVKTAIAGLQAWVLHRLNKFEISEYELIEALAEVDAIQPLANSNNEIYKSKSGQVYIL